MLRAGISQKKVAELLGKTASAVCQELKRHPADTKIGYSAGRAKASTKQKRVEANQRFRKIENNRWLRYYIIQKTKLYWSPEQISGRLKLKYGNDKTKQIGKDSIYKFIYTEKKELAKCLRCQKGKYRRRYGTRIREKQREATKRSSLTNDRLK